jgi:hypothetical protein
MSFLTFIAPLIIWYMGLQAKKRMQKGVLTFKDGLHESFRISLAYATISPFLFLVYYLVFNPSAIDFVRTAYQLQSTINDGQVIIIDMFAQFIAAIIGGTLYGAILTAFLYTKPTVKKAATKKKKR